MCLASRKLRCRRRTCCFQPAAPTTLTSTWKRSWLLLQQVERRPSWPNRYWISCWQLQQPLPPPNLAPCGIIRRKRFIRRCLIWTKHRKTTPRHCNRRLTVIAAPLIRVFRMLDVLHESRISAARSKVKDSSASDLTPNRSGLNSFNTSKLKCLTGFNSFKRCRWVKQLRIRALLRVVAAVAAAAVDAEGTICLSRRQCHHRPRATADVITPTYPAPSLILAEQVLNSHACLTGADCLIDEWICSTGLLESMNAAGTSGAPEPEVQRSRNRHRPVNDFDMVSICSTCSSSSSDEEDDYSYHLPSRKAYGGVRISYVPNDAVALASSRHRAATLQPQTRSEKDKDKNCIIS